MAVGRRIANYLLAFVVVLGLALWVIALLLFSQVAEPTDDFASNAFPIVLINAVGVAVLLGLIGHRLLRLIREYRRFAPGSRLKARVVTLVVIVAAAPLTILYVFALVFIAKGIDEWFPLDVSQALTQSKELATRVLEIRQQDDLAEVRTLAGRLAGEPGEIDARLEESWDDTTAAEVALYTAEGRRIATHSSQGTERAPIRLDETLLAQLPAGTPDSGHVYLDPLTNEAHEVLAATRFRGADGSAHILWGRFPLPLAISQNMLDLQARQDPLEQLDEIKRLLEMAFTLSLSLVLLVAILAAVYAAFFIAERLISPLQHLMQATRAGARGDFDTKVPLNQRDEVGFLVNSFNDMTQKLALARQEAQSSEQRLEGERSKLEVILAGLTTGVVSFAPDLTIRTANKAAGAILGVDLEAHVGESLSAIADSNPLLKQILNVCERHFDHGSVEWREQITLRGDLGRRELTCACKKLPSEGGQEIGFVIVFDDITVLMQAQREAAWGEVARRLAHEIKNPLTPIQLSAERVRRRFLVDGNEDLDLLDRATHTIIQQVDSMKGMVDAFSEYARAPDLDIAPLDLNALIGEVTELYRHQAMPVAIRMELDESLPKIDADIDRLRQVMHNLFRNASEAIEGQADAEILVTTVQRELADGPYVEIVVRDNGPGFAAEIIDRAFLPYVTSKAKGTGLGLAIVRKLVEEHGGKIRAGNNERRGAEVSILLPLTGAGRGAGSTRRAQQRRKRA
jgi:nitrogen fixation/metabolism regulation signal transduction histidine kinase